MASQSKLPEHGIVPVGLRARLEWDVRSHRQNIEQAARHLSHWKTGCAFNHEAFDRQVERIERLFLTCAEPTTMTGEEEDPWRHDEPAPVLLPISAFLR